MHLSIRKMESKDLHPLHEIVSDPETMRYLEPPFSMEKTRAFLEKAGLADPPLIYAAEDEKGQFVGYVIFHDYEESYKEIGWVLNKQFWGRGYAQNLTKQLIERASLEKKGLVMECDPRQQATKKIARTFGFHYIGRIDGLDVFKREHERTHPE